MTVVLIDSPVANVANIRRALATVGAEPQLSADPETIARAAQMVLPGVGSFAAAMRWLTSSGVGEAVIEAAGNGAMLLGICVGHQVLFDDSDEDASPDAVVKGLGLIRGSVRRFGSDLPVPQIGWNTVRAVGAPGASRRGGMPALHDDAAYYFVNSYRADVVDATVAIADYGGPFTAAVQQDRVFGVQFHPEKSSTAGLRVLRDFVELVS